MPGRRIFWLFFLPGVAGVFTHAIAIQYWDFSPTPAFLTAMFATVVTALLISSLVGRTLQEMRRSIERYGAGLLEHRTEIPNTAEFVELATAMNNMARDTHNRLDKLTNERAEQEAVLAAMIEGILAVDNEQNIIRTNRAAGEILNFNHKEAAGRSIQEVVRQPDCLKFIQSALDADGNSMRELQLHSNDRNRRLVLNALPLHDLAEREIGILLVINDVTQLRRLEQVRSDFVANVSHELMTPVTSIKGFIETMLEEGDTQDPEGQRRFLEIVLRQSNRMHSIINDLLALSRLEESSEEETRARWENAALCSLVEDSIQICAQKAEECDIEISLECQNSLHVSVNPALIEQALSNLIDNAIKYSPEDTRVEIRCEEADGMAKISVQDQGCGIAREHLPRIFERFYRVDKARSRKVGGTGLGLSIVKHIAHIHGGTVDVQSRPGAGSTFSIYLPIDPQK